MSGDSKATVERKWDQGAWRAEMAFRIYKSFGARIGYGGGKEVNECNGDVTPTVVRSDQSSCIKESQDSDNGGEQPR